MSNTTNTLNLTDVYAEGDLLVSTIDPTYNVVVVSPYMVDASWMNPSKVRFATATKDLLETLDDVGHLDATDFDPSTLWEDQTGTLVKTRFAEQSISVPDPTKKRKGKKGLGVIPADYKTAYSHLRSADDVVTTDIPDAIGYVAGHSALWADYLAGGEGALKDKKLTDNIMEKGWVSMCCGAYKKTVAGIDLCKTCGGFFESAESEGA